MRWARIETNDGATFAIVEGGDLQLVRGSPFGHWSEAGEKVALAEAKLLVPVQPGTFYAQGSNYRDHLRLYSELWGKPIPVPTQADPGQRSNSALIAHNEAIVIPADASDEVEVEGELAVVIGRQARNLSESEAMSCVLGFTIGNDVSERVWQRSDRTLWRSKNSDTFCPIGPWIETDVHLDSMTTKVRVNGEQRVEHQTRDMIFSVEKVIAALTRYVTLHPGDVLWMGADGYSGRIGHGDVVEVEISGIGILRNPVVRATS